MAASMKSYRHQDYTVALVCALPLEMAAAVAMLDERHRDLPVKQNDDNSYILGRIHVHNVVIACLPFGVYGTTSATTVAAHTRQSFQSIRFFLMVGIGGGVPSKRNDIRLGDVVVSKPTQNYGGVIQYDFGKALSGDRFERTGRLNRPPSVLLTAIAKLEATHMPNPSGILSIISEIAKRRPEVERMYAYPGASQDILFEQGYDHPDSEETCRSCDARRLIERPPREKHGPKIHYGLIASGNQVIKDSRIRDKLAQECDILCFEMEAAGLMDNFPCLVIRGICDYSDSHKNKQWQNYAAATAACYAKELLSAVHGHQIADTPPAGLELSSYVGNKPHRTTSREMIPHTDVDLLKNMSSYDHESIHWNLSQKRLHNTTQWFLDHPSFQEWFIERKISSLWCSGKIGSGKTMIASAVIDLAKSRISSLNSPVVFFYCDHEYNDGLDASFIVSSFIKQICDFQYQNFGYLPKEVAQDLRELFGQEFSEPDTKLPNFDDLEKIFLRLCRVVPDTTYVIDGIDALQITEAIRLLKFVQKLPDSPHKSRKSRILLLSRDQIPGYVNIATFICGICQIRISTNAMQDIEIFIETSIAEKMMYSKLTEDELLLKKVKETLLTESSNMFLWVYLQLEILWKTCHTDADIRYALTALPKTIEETYERCVGRIDFSDGWAIKVLKWVSFAKRPLHIEELREAVAFQLTDTEWDAAKKPQRDFIIGCCANLVILDHISDSVRFAHSSVKQYLEEDIKKDKRRVSEYPTEESGDLECGEYCISYLSFSDFGLQLQKRSLRKAMPSPYSVVQLVSGTRLSNLFFPKPQHQSSTISVPLRTMHIPTPSRAHYKFLDYAVTNWGLHTREMHSESSVWDKFVQLAMSFNEAWSFHPWVPGGRSELSYLHGLFGWAVSKRHKPILSLIIQKGYPIYKFCDLPLVNEGVPAIHLASKYGYGDIIEILLSFCDVNTPDQDGCTPLHHAAIQGHTGIIQLLLLQNGIEVDFNSLNHCTPLWLAASHGHDDIVSLLIDKGAKIEVQDCLLHQTPLWRAVKEGHYATANLLLEKGAQVECCDVSRQTPLGTAIANGDIPMIDLLVSKGAKYEADGTPLLTQLLKWATENRVETLVKLLTEMRINVQNKDLVFPAIQNGYQTVVRVLLEETASSNGQELLLWAAEQEYTILVEQLLEKNVNPNATREWEKITPLHWATRSNHTAIMELLLRKGANIDAKDIYEETPLHWAATHGHITAMNLLLEKGANPNSKHHLGETPLHRAVRYGHISSVMALLEHGADINSKDKYGKAPLHQAVKYGQTAAITLLLENGADINSKDKSGKTPLYATITKGNLETVKLLLENGAHMNSEDNHGMTSLDAARRSGHREIVQLLVENGANQGNARASQRVIRRLNITLKD